MSELKVSVADQVLKITEAPVIASGGVNEVKVIFSFCGKWNGFVKTAIFYRDTDNIYYAILDENDTCIIPWEVYAENGTFYFCVIGDKDDTRRTSTVTRFKVSKGVVADDVMPSEPTQEVYEQLLGMYRETKETTENFIEEVNGSIEKANTAGDRANNIAQDLEEKLAEGYFKGEKGDTGDILSADLTFEQKAQARQNIDAVGRSEYENLVGSLFTGLSQTNANLDTLSANAVLSTEQTLTEEQKAQARENIGAEVAKGQYELIEDITLEEDVESFTRITDKNGQAYNFSAVRIFITTAASTATAQLIIRVASADDGSMVYHQVLEGLKTSARRVSLVARNDCGLLDYQVMLSDDKSTADANLVGRVGKTINSWGNVARITLSTYYKSTQTLPIPAGTRIRIYAVRG